MSFVLALDQGTTSSRALVFDHAGDGARRRAAGVPADLSAAGLGRARRRGDLGDAVGRRCTKRSRKPGSARATSRRSASPTSARRRVVWDRATGRPIANAIVWQDRRTAPLCDELRAAGHAGLIARKTGLVLDAYFSGTKLALAARQRRRRARARDARRARVRHRRHLARLEPDARRGSRHRSVEREPHAALRHPRRRLGRRAARAVRRAARDAPAHRAVVRRLRARVDRRRRRSDRRHRRRPAGGAVRPGVPRAGPREEHLRHRLLPADEHRRQRGRVDATTC